MSLRPCVVMVAVGLLAVAAGCSRANDAVDASEAHQTASGFSVYPTDLRSGLHRLSPLDPQNASVGDFGSPVRNQGSIASCASFGFLGMLENQMFNDRGISPDLSERFMIFSNFFQTGTLGGDTKTIAQFPTMVQNLGLLTEDVYPYAAVDANAARFDQDAAQGLTTDHTLPSLASSVASTAPESRERSEILQRPEFIGALPAGPFPITLPVKAKLQPGARVPELELDGKLVECFSEGGPAAAPPDKQLAVTPREFLAMCFDLDPKAYFTCSFDLGKAGDEAEAAATATDPCGRARETADAVAPRWSAMQVQSLKLALALIDNGDALMMGVTAPASPTNALAVWSTKNLKLGAGHAVLAIGYLTFDELASAVEQERGLLASGMFDKLAATVDPDFAAVLARGLPADAGARRDARVASKLGQRMKTEGGIVLFRNSWGAKIGDFPIGVDGHQAMTFDYFLKAGMLVQGRSQPRIGGVAWPVGAGPDACPGAVNLTQGGSWLAAPERLDEAKEQLRSMAVPASCNQ